MERGERENGETNNSWISHIKVSSYALCKEIFNVLDFIEGLNIEKDQTALDMNQIEKLKLELTFMSTFLQFSYSNLDAFKEDIFGKAQQVNGLVQSISHPSEDAILVKLKDHVVPQLLEYVKSYIHSDHHPKSSFIMSENQLDELLDALLKNLNYLSSCHAKILPLTQYELLQIICANLRDFHGLKITYKGLAYGLLFGQQLRPHEILSSAGFV